VGRAPVVEELKAQARELGLWNLFRPGALSNLDFAPIAELTGWSVLLAPESVNAKLGVTREARAWTELD